MIILSHMMLSRQMGSHLHSHGLNVFCTKGSSWSWFHQVRDICLMYQLPHILDLLNSPLTKEAFKQMTKKHILN